MQRREYCFGKTCEGNLCLVEERKKSFHLKKKINPWIYKPSETPGKVRHKMVAHDMGPVAVWVSRHSDSRA